MRKIGLFSMLLLATALSFANPPPAEAVFQLSAKPLDFNTATLIWTIKPGYFLYQDRIFIEPKENSITRLGEFVLPKATQKTDARGKTYAIYRKQLTFALPILGLEPGESLVSVHYQGCSDAGFCYPPQEVSVKIAINKQLHVDNVTIENLEPIAEPPQKPQPPTVEALFSSNNWVMIILGFFGFGLLLSFTPCVLPMIPVLSGIIVGHGHNLSTRKAFFLSLSYVLSMSLTYSVIGALIAFVGHDLQLTMQSPWAIGLFSAIFILLALSMFDVYQLRLPVSFQAKLANITRHQARGHYLNAAIMGSLSILILSPCVTAPLIGALGYIANKGSVTLGILSLFFLSLGMGTPLLLIGTSAGKLLPKAGQWMNTVKAFFGVMLLAVAIYLLERLLPSVIIMGLWACLLIYSGIYLGAISIAKNKHEKFSQGTGIILLVYGCLILIGASLGHVNPLQPMMKQVHTH
jgi:thioredoxin:protein disulfide reductase